MLRSILLSAMMMAAEYETVSLRTRLSKLYTEVDVTRYEGMGCFRCKKKES